MKFKQYYEVSMKKFFICIIRFIAFALIIICIIYISKWFLDNNATNKILANIKNSNIIEEKSITLNDKVLNIMNINFDELKEENSDTVAWIKINNTKIDYPVLQSSDNNFYLTHSFDKTFNKSGWIFADSTNNFSNSNFDKNTVIYGHNRMNDSMFGTLSNIMSYDWLNNDGLIYLYTPYACTIWKVFSTYTINSEDYYIRTSFSSDEEFKTFLETITNRSTFKIDNSVSYNDNIITLSTCNNVGDGRIVVHAKLLEEIQ